MNHDEAIRLKAAEKYLLGELNAELRDQYEDHYFGCAECAQDVRTGAVFIDNARDVLGSGSVAVAELGAKHLPARSGGWWTALLRPAFFAIPALALLLLVAGYQNAVTIPHLKTALSQSEAAQTLPAFSLISENSRGGAPLAISVPTGKPFSLFVDIPPKGSASYVCEFQTESGTPELSLNISADEAKRTVQLLIPAGRLASGKYVLVVRGLDSQGKSDADKIGVASYPFSLDYTK